MISYEEIYKDEINKKNIDYLSTLDSNKLSNTIVSNGLLQLKPQKGIFNFLKNINADVLPEIYESLDLIDRKLRVIPNLESKDVEKIELAVKNIFNLIQKENINVSNVKTEWNIREKFMKKIHNIEQHLDQIKEVSGLNYVEETSPELFDLVKSCNEGLARSEDKLVNIEERMDSTSRVLGGGGSGTYAAKGEETSTGEKKSLIVKPSVQEFFNMTPGFPKGTNVIRERMGYSIQKELELDCGIPPTTVATMTHKMFGESDLITDMLEKFGVALTRQKFFELTENGKHIDKFYDHLMTYQNEEIKRKMGENLPNALRQEIDNYLNNKIDSLSKELFDFNFLVGNQVIQIKKTRENPEKIIEMANEIMVEINKCEKGKPGVVSCQLMIENCRPVIDLTDKEKERISPKECEKFLIDLMVLNSDRHMGNALVRSTSKEELHSKLETKFRIPMDDFNEIFQDVLEHNKLFGTNKEIHELVEEITKRLSYKDEKILITDKLEKTVSNLVFATINNYDSIFELVLIDHGNILPEPMQEKGGMHSIDCNAHDWSRELPQINNTKITGAAKQKILSLDIMNFVGDL